MFGDVAFAQAPFAALGGATLSSSVAESVTGADSVSQETLAGGIVQEAVSALATFLDLNNILTATAAESSTATASTNFAASTLLASQAESATGSDTVAKVASNYLAAQAESVTATDAPSAIATLLAAIEEISTATDAVDGGRVYEVTVEESVSGTVTQSAVATFRGSIEELASGLDAYGKTKIANVYPAGIQLTVSIGQVLVWGPIPTGQTPPAPDWTDIPT